MKILHSICAIFLLHGGFVLAIKPTWTPEDRAWETKQVALWEENLAKASLLPAHAKFETLALGLRSMGHRASVEGHSPAAGELYERIQQEYLSTPGHATYYRDKLEAAKPKVRTGEMYLTDWSRLLSETTHTLQHLPSEETVEVLVGLAADPFGNPDSKNPGDYKNIPHIEAWDSDLSSAGLAKVSDYACHALEQLEIEPPPYRLEKGKGTPFPWTRQQLWADWFAKVQAGNLRYRFKGSDVLHPVDLPPGAERKPRRPERRETPEEREPQQNSSAPASDEPAQPAESPKWPLVAGIALLILAVSSLAIKRLLKPK